jgi:hypothetical protein
MSQLEQMGDEDWPQEYVGLPKGSRTHVLDFNVQVGFDFDHNWLHNLEPKDQLPPVPTLSTTIKKNVDNIAQVIFEVIRDEYGEPSFDIVVDYLGLDRDEPGYWERYYKDLKNVAVAQALNENDLGRSVGWQTVADGWSILAEHHKGEGT